MSVFTECKWLLTQSLYAHLCKWFVHFYRHVQTSSVASLCRAVNRPLFKGVSLFTEDVTCFDCWLMSSFKIWVIWSRHPTARMFLMCFVKHFVTLFRYVPYNTVVIIILLCKSSLKICFFVIYLQGKCCFLSVISLATLTAVENIRNVHLITCSEPQQHAASLSTPPEVTVILIE